MADDIKFVKYGSIANSYDKKFIKKYLRKFPELEQEHYIITEKIHGANLSVWIYPDGHIKYATRYGFLEKGRKFYDWENTVKHLDFKKKCKKTRNYFEDKNTVIILYGELFGKNIMKGVDYNVNTPNGRDIKFFDVATYDGKTKPKYLNRLFLSDILSPGMIVKVAGITNCLQDALNFNSDFNSLHYKIENNICEGLVIRPLHRDYQIPENSRFILKKKNDKFILKAKAKKVIDENVVSWQAKFTSYINENRLDSVCSKLGEITEKKDIGKYAKELIIDARDDFIKDHGEEIESQNLYIDKVCKQAKKAGTLILARIANA